MFTIDITQWVPRFILNDKNGYAVARAIEYLLNRMNATISDGVKCVTDVDEMPEWRLDEMAWELNCLYDGNADVEQKRNWIRNAVPYYQLYGTPRALYTYLEGYFEDIELEEAWQYGGEPFHFRVTLGGEWSAENEAWARKAIQAAKNVRSVMDGVTAGDVCDIVIDSREDGKYSFPYPMTSETLMAGTRPNTATLGILSNTDVEAGAEMGAAAYVIQYKMCGSTNL